MTSAVSPQEHLPDASLAVVVARLADQVERLALVIDRAGLTAESSPAAGEFLDAAQVAELLGCSARSVWKWSKTGELPNGTPLGRLVKWRRSEIEAVLRKRQSRRR